MTWNSLLILATSNTLAWTAVIVSAVGMCVSLLALWDARKDLDALDHTALNGARHIVARASVRRETFRFLLQVLLGVVALVTLMMPGIPPVMPQPVVSSVGLRNILRLLTAIILAVSTIWDRIDRYRLFAALNQHNRT